MTVQDVLYTIRPIAQGLANHPLLDKPMATAADFLFDSAQHFASHHNARDLANAQADAQTVAAAMIAFIVKTSR